MFYSKIVFWLLVCFFVSVWSAPSFEIPHYGWIVLSALFLAAILAPLRFRIIILAASFILLGNLLFWSYKAHFDQLIMEKVYLTELTGILTAQPKQWGIGFQQKVFLPVIDRAIYLTSSMDYGLDYGDEIKFFCLKGFESDDLAKDRVVGRCKTNGIKIISRHNGIWPIKKVYQLKTFLIRRISRSLPQPHGPLLAGLLLGGNQGLSKEQVEKFRNSGVSHIMAVSGFNVMIVINGVIALLAPLYFSRKKLFIVISCSLILFILLTGFESSIIRAVLMAWVMVAAKTIGRYLNVRNLIVFAAFSMVATNPYVLRYDLGFQLSFAATAGLMFGAPWVAKKLRFEKIPWGWVETFLSSYVLPSIVAYLVTLPIIFFAFGKISLVAPLANIIIAPLVPLAMALGGVLLLVAGIPGLDALISSFNWLALSAILQVVNVFG